jgi:hypothetical protein
LLPYAFYSSSWSINELVFKLTTWTELASERAGLVTLTHQPLGYAFFTEVVSALPTPERFPQNLETYRAPEVYDSIILKTKAFIVLLLVSYFLCLLIRIH